MNKAGGFITLYRQMTSWEWYKDSATKDLFIHLLLTANFTDTRFLGKKIKRGQVVTSLASLASETGLSIQQIKTAIKHLISTNEITNDSTRKYRIITVVKYNDYQDLTKALTNNQQTANKQLTNSQQYHNKGNNVNKGIKKSVCTFTPPSLEDVKSFCEENKIQIDASRFYYHYESIGWMVGRAKMKDWKMAVRKWEANDKNGRRQENPGNNGTAEEKPGKYEYLRSTITYL